MDRDDLSFAWLEWKHPFNIITEPCLCSLFNPIFQSLEIGMINILTNKLLKKKMSYYVLKKSKRFVWKLIIHACSPSPSSQQQKWDFPGIKRNFGHVQIVKRLRILALGRTPLSKILVNDSQNCLKFYNWTTNFQAYMTFLTLCFVLPEKRGKKDKWVFKI